MITDGDIIYYVDKDIDFVVEDPTILSKLVGFNDLYNDWLSKKTLYD